MDENNHKALHDLQPSDASQRETIDAVWFTRFHTWKSHVVLSCSLSDAGRQEKTIL